jgi:hypothetical protein
VSTEFGDTVQAKLEEIGVKILLDEEILFEKETMDAYHDHRIHYFTTKKEFVSNKSSLFSHFCFFVLSLLVSFFFSFSRL